MDLVGDMLTFDLQPISSKVIDLGKILPALVIFFFLLFKNKRNEPNK